MNTTESEFFDLALACGALRFGDFTLKSGRKSPYFFNIAAFATGNAMLTLGRLYARAISAENIDFTMVFGPAYKGIPLALALTIGFALDYHRDVPYAFNRKETKDHGEGGLIVGPPLSGRILVIDDVISAGTSIGESAGFIEAAGATLAVVAIALDREERGSGSQSAATEVALRYGIPVVRLGRLAGLLTYLEKNASVRHHLPAVAAYRERYGST